MMNRFCRNLTLACLIGMLSPIAFAQSNQGLSESNHQALANGSHSTELPAITANSSDQQKFQFLFKNLVTHIAQTSPSSNDFGILDTNKIPNEILLNATQSKQLILANTFQIIELHQLLMRQNAHWPFSKQLITSMPKDAPYDFNQVRVCYLQKMTPEYVNQYYSSLADAMLNSENEKQVRAQLSYIYYGQQLPVLKKANNELLKDIQKRLNQYRKSNSKNYGKDLDIELLPDVFKDYRYESASKSNVPSFHSFAQRLFIQPIAVLDHWTPLNTVLPLTPEITSKQYLRLSTAIFKSCGVDVNIEKF